MKVDFHKKVPRVLSNCQRACESRGLSFEGAVSAKTSKLAAVLQARVRLGFVNFRVYWPFMNWMILRTHYALLTLVAVVTTLIVALSLSLLVQQLDGNIRGALGPVPYFPVAGLIVILTTLCVPWLNSFMIAPKNLGHVFGQLGICLCGAALIIWAGAIALATPLAVWLVPFNAAPFFVLGLGALYICLGLIGALGFFARRTGEHVYDTVYALRRVHFFARGLAAICAFVVSGVILGSVLVLNSPTTRTTMICSGIVFCLGGILGSSRLSVANIEKPISQWNIGLQFAAACAAVFALEVCTRAFVFHTHIFDKQPDIDVVYPWLANLLMLPFIVFGLTSIALALTRQKRASEDMAEVFA